MKSLDETLQLAAPFLARLFGSPDNYEIISSRPMGDIFPDDGYYFVTLIGTQAALVPGLLVYCKLLACNGVVFDMDFLKCNPIAA